MLLRLALRRGIAPRHVFWSLACLHAALFVRRDSCARRWRDCCCNLLPPNPPSLPRPRLRPQQVARNGVVSEFHSMGFHIGLPPEGSIFDYMFDFNNLK